MRSIKAMPTSILIIIVLVICLVIVISLFINRRPRRVFARIFEFELPESAQFIEYHFESSGDYLETMIRIDQYDLEVLKQNLISFFGEEAPEDAEYWGNTNPWWDLSDKDTILRFEGMVEGKRFLFGLAYIKTSIIWAFLAENSDCEYYLYIDKA